MSSFLKVTNVLVLQAVSLKIIKALEINKDNDDDTSRDNHQPNN